MSDADEPDSNAQLLLGPLLRYAFDNAIGELELEGRSARVTVRRGAHQGEDVEGLLSVDRDTTASKPPASTEEVLDVANT